MFKVFLTFTLQEVTPEGMRQAYEVNCIAPLFLTRTLLPLMQKAADANKDMKVRYLGDLKNQQFLVATWIWTMVSFNQSINLSR